MPRKKNIGFTIVEMAIVIAVMAIMLTATVPALDRAVNSYKRNTIAINIESLNALMDDALTEQESISFTEAYAISETLYANSETIKDTQRLSDYLGADKGLNAAVLYDSEEGKWLCLSSERSTDIYTMLEDYYEARYFLPIRTQSECEYFYNTGISLALLSDVDVSKLVDEDGTLTLRGGLALNGYTLSSARKILLAGDGAAAELISGKAVYKDENNGEKYASLVFGTGDGEVQSGRLLAGTGSEAADWMAQSTLSIVHVSDFSVSGEVTAQSLQINGSGVTLLPEASVMVNELNVEEETAFLKAGEMRVGGDYLTENSYSGGKLTAAQCAGDGCFICGPVTYQISGSKFVPVEVCIDMESAAADENGRAYPVVKQLIQVGDGPIQTLYLTQNVFNGNLCYQLSPKGELSLYSVRVDETTLCLSDQGEEKLLDADGHIAIGAVTYSADMLGTLRPYSVCVGEKLRLSESDTGVTYYVGEDGKTLYIKAEVGGEETLTKTGYYYLQGSDKLSTEYYYTVTYHYYSSNGTRVKYCENVQPGGSAYLPSPSRTGYSFGGWYENETLTGEPYAAGTVLSNVMSDITLYAKWQRGEPLALTLNLGAAADSPVDLGSFELEVGGKMFRCSADGAEFAGAVVISGERYTLLQTNGQYALLNKKQEKMNAYGYDEASGDVYRCDTGVTVCSAETPTVGLTANQTVIVHAKGQSGRVTLPNAGRTGYALKGWSKSGTVIADGGDTITLTGSLSLRAEWIEASANKMASISYYIKTTSGEWVPITNRIYRTDAGKATLQSAAILVGGVKYLYADGKLTSGTESYTVSQAKTALGLTDKLRFVSAAKEKTVGYGTLTESGNGFSVKITELDYDNKTFPVTDGALAGGTLTGSITATAGADTYTYALNSRMDTALTYSLTSVWRGGTTYACSNSAVAIGEKTYRADNADKPGSTTLAMSRIQYEGRSYSVQANYATIAYEDTGNLGNYSVRYQVTDNPFGTDYSLKATELIVQDTAYEVKNNQVTVNGETYQVSVRVGESRQTDGSGISVCTHDADSFFTRTVDGVEVTVYGCEKCGAYAASGTTITLSENLTLDAPLYIPKGNTYTLNLNGHNIVTQGDAIYNCGTLTVKSDGFTLPELETDQNDNLLFVSGSMKGYIIVNNGSATEDGKVNKNGIVNWGTLHAEAVGIAVSDTYGSAIVNSGDGTTTVENAAVLNTGLGNGIYANSGRVTLNKGTVVWSTTYGFAVFAYNDSEVILNDGSYYSTAGFPFCICGGRLDINRYCVTDRSADSAYQNYVEADGLSGEIYWLAGTLDTRGLDAIFQYSNTAYDSGLYHYGATEKKWVFPKDFAVVVALEADDVYYDQWSSQIYRAANWTPEDPEYYEIDTEYIPDYVVEDKRVIQSSLDCYSSYVEDININSTTYKGIRYNNDGVYFNPFLTNGQNG